MKARFPQAPLVIGANETELLTDPHLNMSAPFGVSIVSPPADRTVREGDVVEAIDGALVERTRLVVVDHVTSATATIFPVEEIVARTRARGVPVLVDAAHVPGMIPVSARSLRADYWTGNFHKWVCAPKGSAALWVAPEHRDRVRPLVTSHRAGAGFTAEFGFTGTDDYTAHLTVARAIALMDDLGWDRVRAHNHALVTMAQRLACDAIGTVPPLAENRFGSMAIVPLPPTLATDAEGAAALQRRLFDDDRIEVPVFTWNARPYIRLSAHVYNRPAEYEALADALARLARSG
jgi:isopenicillin-N epimerase